MGDTRQSQGCRSWSLPWQSGRTPVWSIPDPSRWLRSPVAVPTTPHTGVPLAALGTTSQQQDGVPGGLGVPAAPFLPAPVSLSPQALPADQLPGKKPRNYKEGRCVSQREGDGGGPGMSPAVADGLTQGALFLLVSLIRCNRIPEGGMWERGRARGAPAWTGVGAGAASLALACQAAHCSCPGCHWAPPGTMWH